jgi:FlaG/FlaF family flagellin (archaellin)
MKNWLKYLKRSRAISPVIATVLLIGLVVIAGLGVALVIFGTINTPDALKIEVVSISSFETTDNDYLIDKLDITLENEERTNVLVKIDGFSLLYMNQTEIQGWYMDLAQQEILIPALTIQTIPIACDNSIDQNELVAQNTTIYIDVTVFPEGKDDSRHAEIFRSDLLLVGDTYGPLTLIAENPSDLFGKEGLIMNFSVSNNGSTDLNLKLDFSTDATDKIFFIINGVNKTTHSFSLSGFGITNFQFDLFELNTTALASPSETYLVFVTLWDSDSLRLLATQSLLPTYEP